MIQHKQMWISRNAGIPRQHLLVLILWAIVDLYSDKTLFSNGCKLPILLKKPIQNMAPSAPFPAYFEKNMFSSPLGFNHGILDIATCVSLGVILDNGNIP